MEWYNYLLLLIAFLGWAWGIAQFFIHRQNQKKDKLIDRRYEAYSTYMKKVDELMKSIRTNPNMVYGISSEFMGSVITGNEDQINEALIQFNKKLLSFVKTATEPLLIIKQELNSLFIICSEELIPKIQEMDSLITDFNDEMQKALSMISPNDSNNMIKQLETISQNNRIIRFESLNKEIINQMRQELGNRKNT